MVQKFDFCKHFVALCFLNDSVKSEKALSISTFHYSLQYRFLLFFIRNSSSSVTKPFLVNLLIMLACEMYWPWIP